MEAEARKPIGGWLYLWAFWLYVGPVFGFFRMLQSLLPMLDETFETAGAVEGLQAAIVIEFLAAAIVFALTVYCASLFSRRDPRTPAYVVLLMVVSLSTSLLTVAMLWFVSADFQGDARTTAGESIAGSFGAVLPMVLFYPPFTLYWTRGKRVRATFGG